MFNKKDIEQIQKRGTILEIVNQQIEHFKNGFPYLKIVAPAILGKGIRIIKQEEVKKYTTLYEKSLSHVTPLKFIPSSGAASRMFKFLFEFKEAFIKQQDSIDISRFKEAHLFFENLPRFAFYKDLEKEYYKHTHQTLLHGLYKKRYSEILDILLSEEKLNYANLPKALIPFHRYGNKSRTPLEEHLVEGAYYAKNTENIVRLHFTVSKIHKRIFEEKIENVIPFYEKELKVRYRIDMSVQNPATDTISVNLDNTPFRNPDGSILFRPGGHGALIENLDKIDSNLIFIKNIDNVIPDQLRMQTYIYKKVLAGILCEIQSEIHTYLKKMTTNLEDRILLQEVENFLVKKLYTLLPPDFKDWSNSKKFHFLKWKFYRPIRICGMIRDRGEPGGGPFWVKNTDGTISLQIAEANQIDSQDSRQKEILKRTTHFSPADIVCSTTDYQGKKFNLLKYRDLQTGFISEKSKNGKLFKAQELPGLWNGAMSDWNTIFVEVPIETFNPVKTVNDLLRKAHQD